jgi:hypothetical protein
VTETERQILTALKELNSAIQSMATANPKPNLLPIFERIETLRIALPTDTDPNLLHYLYKHSYEKARLWLEGRDSENAVGSCRH